LSTLLKTSLSGDKELNAKFAIVYTWDYWRTFAPFVSARLLASGNPGCTRRRLTEAHRMDRDPL
jgi:hypothetical protein